MKNKNSFILNTFNGQSIYKGQVNWAIVRKYNTKNIKKPLIKNYTN